MKSRLGGAALLLAVIGFQFAVAGKAFAIAAFSRQHKTECTTCHTIYPELNEYGEAFRKNGFIWFSRAPAGKDEPSEDIRGGGDDAEQLAQLKAMSAIKRKEQQKEKARPDEPKGRVNEGIRLAGIPELLPLSLTASLDFAYDEHAANNNKVDLSTRSLVLQSGGAFSDKAGFYVTYTAYTQGLYAPATSNTPGNNNPNIDELFLVWHHAFDSPVNVRAGRFQPQLTLWKNSNKLTVSSFAPAAYRVGRSLFSVDATEDAVELNAIVGNRLFVAGGMVDRDGQNTKEGYGHLSIKLGGADFVGHEPDIDLDSDSLWDYLSVTFGMFGYSGKNANIVGLTAQNFNNYYRAGLEMDLLYKQLRLRVSSVHGRDSNPSLSPLASRIRSLVVASEAEYMFDTNLIGVLRYEYQDDGSGITRRFIPSVSYAPLQNIKLTLEYNYEAISPYASADSINRIALLGAKFSF